MASRAAPADEEKKPPQDVTDVWSAGHKHVFYTDHGKKYFNLVALHRMNLHCIRKRILDQASSILDGTSKLEEPSVSEPLTLLMHQYCQAVFDRDYMREWSKREWGDSPFILCSERKMEKWLLDELANHSIEPNRIVKYDEDRNMPGLPMGPWDYWTAWGAVYERVLMLVVGSIMLVGPMILMVLVPKIVTRLVTVGVCTVLFALFTGWYGTDLKPIELLQATAAYTAVLVVFVGTTSGSA